MDHYIVKSEINLSAAQFLFRHTYFLPVVHCSYYSCFQYMKYILENSPEHYLKNRNKNVGSHLELITVVKKLIKQKSLNYRYFYRDILLLKRLRVGADYHKEFVNKESSFLSISLALSIQKILSKCI